jgi:hypothetical protein
MAVSWQTRIKARIACCPSNGIRPRRLYPDYHSAKEPEIWRMQYKFTPLAGPRF